MYDTFILNQIFMYFKKKLCRINLNVYFYLGNSIFFFIFIWHFLQFFFFFFTFPHCLFKKNCLSIFLKKLLTQFLQNCCLFPQQ